MFCLRFGVHILWFLLVVVVVVAAISGKQYLTLDSKCIASELGFSFYLSLLKAIP